jgi:hypothetical protein
MMKVKDIIRRSNAKDQRASFHTVPITVFPMSIVMIEVIVLIGSKKDLGITGRFPITI